MGVNRFFVHCEGVFEGSSLNPNKFHNNKLFIQFRAEFHVLKLFVSSQNDPEKREACV